ncbi:MAG: LCP family protein [Clostridia bacterium]|nr:LCP family protein [Clostridia bacterium]
MKGKKKNKVVKIVSISVITISVLTIAAVLALTWRPFREGGNAITLSGTTSKISAVATSSNQQAWSGNTANFLVCGIDKTNLLTDVIMVISFNNQTGKISMLQIPRDTYAGPDVISQKYNAIYGHPPKGVSGMEYLKARIQLDFGIKIDHYLALTTNGFDNLVNSVGGIDFYVPITMNYDDSAQDLHIHLKKGFQHLNGNQAEQFVRDRHSWAQGDIGRLQAQKSFLAAFAAKLKKQSLITLTTHVLPTIMPPNFKTDMTTLQMLEFGLAAKKVDLSKVTVYTSPGTSYIDPSNKLSYYTIYKDQLINILNKSFVANGENLTVGDIKIEQRVSSPSSTTSSESSGDNFQDLYNSSQSKSSSSKK